VLHPRTASVAASSAARVHARPGSAGTTGRARASTGCGRRSAHPRPTISSAGVTGGLLGHPRCAAGSATVTPSLGGPGGGAGGRDPDRAVLGSLNAAAPRPVAPSHAPGHYAASEPGITARGPNLARARSATSSRRRTFSSTGSKVS